jgi:nucleotide-binding universal stress UspA family protein
MKLIQTVLVPTDLSERSRRAVEYGASLAAENKGQLLIMHVANELTAWEFYDDAFGYSQVWPLDRVLEEAALDLNRFLEAQGAALSRVPRIAKRLALGCIPEQIVTLASEAKADLIVLSPRRERGWRSLFTAGIPERVTRLIVISAVHEKVDLIIMAKRHLGFARRLISRSISEQVSRKAPCPVLSICPPKLQRPIPAQPQAVPGAMVGAEV